MKKIFKKSVLDKFSEKDLNEIKEIYDDITAHEYSLDLVAKRKLLKNTDLKKIMVV